jgi:hypothetical protein
VPVLLDGDRAVVDSWTIANYLEDTYPERPSLFGGEGGRAMGRMLNWWGDGVIGGMFPLIIADIPLNLKPEDAAYFAKAARRALAGRWKKSWPAATSAVEGFRKSLDPLRLTLRTQASSAALPRTMRTISCSARSSGRGWSPVQVADGRRIRSMPGASGCSTRSMGWRGSRRAITA